MRLLEARIRWLFASPGFSGSLSVLLNYCITEVVHCKSTTFFDTRKLFPEFFEKTLFYALRCRVARQEKSKAINTMPAMAKTKEFQPWEVSTRPEEAPMMLEPT